IPSNRSGNSDEGHDISVHPVAPAAQPRHPPPAVEGQPMKGLAPFLACAMLAGCSQTSDTPDASSPAQVGAYGAPRQATSAKTADRCANAVREQATSAMLGSALRMAGSLGGFGGRGGMIAAQVAGTAGSMVASSQQQQAQANVMRECVQQ